MIWSRFKLPGALPRLLIAGSFACIGCAQSPDGGNAPVGSGTQGTRPLDEITTQANVERLEHGLAHDSMEGRQVGTPGAARAARFIAAEMQSIGLLPAGDNGTYFQDVTGTAVPAYTGGAFTVGGSALQWNTDFTVATTTLTPIPTIDAEVIYGGVAGDSLRTIAPEQAVGKVVVLSVAPPAPRGTGAAPAGAGAAGRAGGRAGGNPYAPNVRFAGAAAIVTANLDAMTPAAMARATNPAQAQSPRAAASAPAQLRITTAAARRIFNAPLSDVTPGIIAGRGAIRLDHRLTPRPEWTRNVISIIPGSDPVLKNEWVIVDAHYDHLGIRAPVDGDSIYNGADDDASGTVAMLEIARALKAGPAPKRSVIFAAMTGEESGLIGTRFYIENPTVPLSQMVANLEIEMIGRADSLAGGHGKAWLTGYERSTMGEMLAAEGIPIVQDPRPGENFFRRSDNYAFALAGIPAHTLSTFNLHTDYHRPTDDVSGIDFVHMTEVIRAGARAARILVDGPKPEWKPGGRPASVGN